jgi:hypothetical protein
LGGRFGDGLRSLYAAAGQKASSGNAVRQTAYRAMGEPVAGALVGFVSRQS